MVITDVNQITYNGDGVTTAWPFTFPIIDYTDLKLTLINSAGARTDITSDYYVDMVNNTVYYPGYAPGAEPPEANQPPKVQSGEKLEIYRRVPVNQLADLGEKWPFNVIEKGLDKLTMICQDIYSWIGRNIVGLTEDGTAWDARNLPISNVGGPVNVEDAATKDYVDRILNGFVLEGDSRTVPFDNVAQMLAADLEVGQIAFTLGYYDIGDGGHGVYNIRPKTPYDVDDGGSIIFLDNDNVAEIITDGIINVKQFGAVGDGLTDDSTAIQNACAFGHKVLFKTGENYKLSNVTLSHDIELVGDDVTFTCKPATGGNNQIDFVFIGSNINVKIHGFDFVGCGTQTTQTSLHKSLLDFNGCVVDIQFCKFHDVVAQYWNVDADTWDERKGIVITNINGSTSITDCEFYNFEGEEITWLLSDSDTYTENGYMIFERNNVHDINGYSFNLDGGSYVSFSHNNIDNYSYGGSILNICGFNCIVDGNTVTNSTVKECFDAQEAGYIFAENYTVINNTVDSTYAYGYFIGANSKHTVVKNNTVNGHGMFLWAVNYYNSSTNPVTFDARTYDISDNVYNIADENTKSYSAIVISHEGYYSAPLVLTGYVESVTIKHNIFNYPANVTNSQEVIKLGNNIRNINISENTVYNMPAWEDSAAYNLFTGLRFYRNNTIKDLTIVGNVLDHTNSTRNSSLAFLIIDNSSSATEDPFDINTDVAIVNVLMELDFGNNDTFNNSYAKINYIDYVHEERGEQTESSIAAGATAEVTITFKKIYIMAPVFVYSIRCWDDPDAFSSIIKTSDKTSATLRIKNNTANTLTAYINYMVLPKFL